MKTARVLFEGLERKAMPSASKGPAWLQLDDGRHVAEKDVEFLLPVVPGTIIALGLNYADHVKELASELTLNKAKDEPLVFLKSPHALVGHNGATPRPADAGFMHYECELAVVMGQPAKQVKATQALGYVAGYTVCNDYAVRDYLENWYRPNLRVKNRDAATALGPWLVSADEVPDPQALALRTRVNGKVTQAGHTRDMVHSVADLIEYLSGFMTLLPGDLILTGTPSGVVNVNVGDVVECEIDGIGTLRNTLVAETT